MGMMPWFGSDGAMHVLGGLLAVLFWVAVVLVIVWLVHRFLNTERHTQGSTPLDILERR